MKNGTVSLNQFSPDVSNVLTPLIGSHEQTIITLGDVRMNASLQVVPVAYLSSPLYILRYRIIGYNNTYGSNINIKDIKKLSLTNRNNNNNAEEEDGEDVEDANSDAADRNSGGSDIESDKIRNKSTPSPKFLSSSKTKVAKDSTPHYHSPTAKLIVNTPTSHPPISLGDDISLCPVMGGGSTPNTVKPSKNNVTDPLVTGTTNGTINNDSVSLLPGQAETTSPPVSSRWLSPSIDKDNNPATNDSKLNKNETKTDTQVAPVVPTSLNTAIDIPTDGKEINISDSRVTENLTNSSTNRDPQVPYTPSNQSILRSMDPKRDSRILKVNFNGNDNTNNNADSSKNSQLHTMYPYPSGSTIDNTNGSSIFYNSSQTSLTNNQYPGSSENQLSPSKQGTNYSLLKSDSESALHLNPENKSVTTATNNTHIIRIDSDYRDEDDDPSINRSTNRSHGKKSSIKISGNGTVITKSSGGSDGSVTDLLRKGVQASGARLERSLTTLKTSIVAVFIIIAVLNIVSLVITTILFTDLKKSLVLVAMSGDRGLEMNRAMGHIQSLVFSAEQKFTIPEGTGYIQDRLTVWADKLETLHRELYLSVDSSALPEEFQLYNEPVIKMHDLFPESYVNRTYWKAKQRNVGLVNAVLELISKIRAVQALPNENITLDQVPVWFVLTNGMEGLLQAVNKSLMYADERTRGHVDNIELTNLIVMAIAESIVGIIVIGVMIPAVNSVSRTKQNVFNTFLEVPVNIIRALRNRVQKKLEAIIRSENGEDHGIDINETGGVTDDGESSAHELQSLDKHKQASAGGGHNGHTPGKQQVGSASGSVSSGDSSLNRALQAYHASNQNTLLEIAEHSEDDYEEESKCCRCCTRSTPVLSATNRKIDVPVLDKNIRRRRRNFRNTRSSRGVVLLTMVAPLLCYVIFFAAMYEWRFLESVGVRYIKAEMLWSKQAELYSALTDIYVRNAVGYCDPEFMDLSLNQTEFATNNLEYLQNSLIYGNENILVRSGIHLSTDIYNLAMVNGCTEDNDNAYNLTTCQSSFYNGIFGKGFQQGFREYLFLNRQIIDQQRLLLEMDPTLTTTCDPKKSLNSLVVNNIDQMRWRFLLGGLAHFTNLRLHLSNTRFDNFVVANIVITVFTIFALQIFYSALYRPMIRTMDKEIKNVRLLLLLFPDEVSKQVPAIIAAGKELISDTASVASGSTA